MFQVVFSSKANNGIFVPFDRRTIFTSVAEAKTYMASRSMYPIVWTNTGCEPYPAYGSDGESRGFEYMMVKLAIFGNDAVVVPIEKIKAMQEILDRMSARLDAYPGQTEQQIADHKMDGDID